MRDTPIAVRDPLPPREHLLARPAKPIPERVEDLAQLEAQVEAIRREARLLTAGLTDDQFNWQADQTRWSIAHCLQHLVLAADGLLRSQEAAIDRARARGLLSNGPYRHGRLRSMMATSQEPPVGRRFKASRPIVPRGRHSLDMLVSAFDQRQQRILQVLARARGVDLGRTP